MMSTTNMNTNNNNKMNNAAPLNRRRRGYTTKGSSTVKSFHKNDQTTIPRRRRHFDYVAPSMPRCNNYYDAMLDPYSNGDNNINNYYNKQTTAVTTHSNKVTTSNRHRGYTIGSTTVLPYNNNNNMSSAPRTATLCKDCTKGGSSHYANKDPYNTTHLTEFEPGEIVELDKENICQQQESVTKRSETIGTVSARAVLEAAEKEASKRNMSRTERSAYIAQELSRWKKEQKGIARLEAM